MGNQILGGKKRKNKNFIGGAFNASDIQTIIHIVDTQLTKHNLISESQAIVSPSAITTKSPIIEAPIIEAPIIEAPSPTFSIETMYEVLDMLSDILKTDNLYIYTIMLKSINSQYLEPFIQVLINKINALGTIKLDKKTLLDIKSSFSDFISTYCMDFISMDPNYKHGRVPDGSIVKNASKSLGHGATSVVHIGTYSDSNTYFYAIKDNCADSILSSLDHPFIVKLFSIQRKICILEYCINIDKHNISNICSKQLFVQLIFALAYLESKCISHGDLHDNNIMIGRDGFLRIIDFDKHYDYSEFKKLDPNFCVYEDQLSLRNKINYNSFDYSNNCFHDLFKEDKNHKYMASFLLLIGSFDEIRPSFTFEQLKNCNYIKYDHNDSTEYWNLLTQKERMYYEI
jgi:hypothetical protein